jgi:hypothetical protein
MTRRGTAVTRPARPADPAAGNGAARRGRPGAASMVRACASGEAETLAPPRSAAALLRAGFIPEDEAILLLLRPSLLYIPLASLGGLAVIALVTFALAYLARVQWLSWVGWTDRDAFFLGLSLAALRLSWQALEWSCRVYVLTDRRVIRRMGVLRVSIFQAELRRIQHTSIFRRLRERACGLGTIGFATAGSHSFDAFWVMVANPFDVHRTVSEAIQRYGRR